MPKVTLHRLVNRGDGLWGRVEADGSITLGSLLADDEGVIRFVTVERLADMQGVGVYSGAGGYGVYEESGG